MPTITYVNDEGQVVEEELTSRRVTFVEGGDDQIDQSEGEFRPAVVERLEYDHEGQMSSITTVCGETENRRESDEKPKIIVEGIVTESQIPQMQALKQLDAVTLVSDLYQGQVEIRRVTIEQTTDLIEAEFDDGETELIFAFQIQLRAP